MYPGELGIVDEPPRRPFRPGVCVALASVCGVFQEPVYLAFFLACVMWETGMIRGCTHPLYPG